MVGLEVRATLCLSWGVCCALSLDHTESLVGGGGSYVGDDLWRW